MQSISYKYLPTIWQVTLCVACRFLEKKEEGKCKAFLKIPSDDMAGDALRRVPIP